MYGTPVLGANIGGIPELIQAGKTGELFESGKVSALKNRIAEMCRAEKIVSEYPKHCADISFDTTAEYAKRLIKDCCHV